MKLIKKYTYFLNIIFISVIIYVLINGISIWQYAKTDEKQPSDTIIILGAAVAGNEVSPVFRERINHGIWLYKNGYSDSIIITGGISDGNTYSDAYIGKIYAISQGVNEKDILIEESSEITQGNIANAKIIMDNAGYNSAIIVSDPLHMKRAMLMAEDYSIKAYSSPTPATMYRSTKNKLVFWGRELFFYLGYKLWRYLV